MQQQEQSSQISGYNSIASLHPRNSKNSTDGLQQLEQNKSTPRKNT